MTDDVETGSRAVRLSTETRQHLFDTPYHAIALEHDPACFVTTDDGYRRPAEDLGRIVALREWVSRCLPGER